MTPAIALVRKRKLPFSIHQYAHDETAQSYGLEAAEKLSQNPARVFKTLVVQPDSGPLAVAVLPVRERLDLKAFAKTVRCKKVAMARQADVERATGYVLGGVSPLAQKRALKTVLDRSATAFSTVYISAGRRGLELELAPSDLVLLTRAIVADICQKPQSSV